jgi:hypothetical protein
MTKEQFILDSIKPMAQYTFAFITSVVGIIDQHQGRHVGSGLRAIWKGRRVVMTARHVIEEAVKTRGFALATGYGKSPYVAHGPIDCDLVGDLAIYYLPDDFPDSAPEKQFWPEDRIQCSTERLTTDFLFVHGFPRVRSRFLHRVTGVASRSLPYGAMQRTEPLKQALEAHQFAIEFDPSGMRNIERDQEDFIDPDGLSGSPVWRIGISGKSRAEWSPALSLVVGFVTQWRQDERVLIATSAARLSEMKASHQLLF